MVAPTLKPRFAAHASTMANLVVMACFLPIVVMAAENLVLHPRAPVWARIMGAIIIAPVVVFYGVAIKLCTLREPVIEIDERGLLWRRWSPVRIPWSAFAGWRARSGKFVTLELRDRTAYPARTINGLLAIGNRWLGFKDITLSVGGTDAQFQDLVAAVRAYAPTPEGKG